MSALMMSKDEMLAMMAAFMRDNGIGMDELLDKIREQEVQAETVESLARNCRAGRWDLVLPACQYGLRDEALALDLFEHIFRTLLLAGNQVDSARKLLEQSTILGVIMKQKHPQRHAELLALLQNSGGAVFDEGEMASQRELLANRLLAMPTPTKHVANEYSLIELLRDGLRHRAESAPKRLQRRASFDQFGKDVHIQSAATADAAWLFLGMSDGIVEQFELETLRRMEAGILVDSPITALCASPLPSSPGTILLCVGEETGTASLFQISPPAKNEQEQQEQRLLKFSTGFSPVVQVVFCAQATRLAVIGGGAGDVCRFFSTKTCNLLWEYSAQFHWIAPAPSYDAGAYLLSSNPSDAVISVWDACNHRAERVAQIPLPPGGGKVLRIERGGYVLVSNAGIYRLMTQKEDWNRAELVCAGSDMLDFCLEEEQVLLVLVSSPATAAHAFKRFHLPSKTWETSAALVQPKQTWGRFITLISSVAVWTNRIAKV